MATRQAESMALKKRIDALKPMGWRIEQVGATNGGGTRGGEYRIWPPEGRGEGRTYQLHLTYSDVNSLNALKRDLEKCGLSDDELALKSNRLKRNALKLKEEREAAEKKAQELAANNTAMLQKAAGPYLVEPEECDLQWLTTPHPRPWMRWMYITPKAAQFILDHHNTDNRKMGEGDPKRYAQLILADAPEREGTLTFGSPGLWHLTHQGLAFDTRGLVQDAQHRLMGIVLAGEVRPDIKVPFAVFVGMPVENFKAIDEGRLRTAAQMLAKAGVPGGPKMITIMRAVAAFESENPRGFNRGTKFTQQMAWQRWEQDPDGWSAALAIGTRAHRQTGKLLPEGAIGAAYLILRRLNGADNPYLTAFFEGLIRQRKYRTDYVLPDGDPRDALLRRFRTGRPPQPIEGVFWVIQSWNNLVQGHHPLSLRFSEKNAPPTPLMCIPGEGKTPRALYGELVDLDHEDKVAA